MPKSFKATFFLKMAKYPACGMKKRFFGSTLGDHARCMPARKIIWHEPLDENKRPFYE